jgi:hypothetical protein
MKTPQRFEITSGAARDAIGGELLNSVLGRFRCHFVKLAAIP